MKPRKPKRRPADRIRAILSPRQLTAFDLGEFVECDACAIKPGSPTLCAGCQANRYRIYTLDAPEARKPPKPTHHQRAALQLAASGHGVLFHDDDGRWRPSAGGPSRAITRTIDACAAAGWLVIRNGVDRLTGKTLAILTDAGRKRLAEQP